jgi:hypothetical protein
VSRSVLAPERYAAFFQFNCFFMTYRHSDHFRMKTGISIALMIYFTVNLSGQKVLTDTFYVPFRYDTLVEIKNICLSKVEDKRDEDPNFVRYDTKTRYLLFPSDQEVYTREPLAGEICKGVPCDSSGTQYVLDINKFSIEKQKGRISSSLWLVADILVYEKMEDTLEYRGTLYYDYEYLPHARKESLEQSTINLLSEWHTEFKIDLLGLHSDNSGALSGYHTHFITDPKVRSLYANVSVSSFAGFNWWGLQAEVYFMRPETEKQNHYISGIVRYQNTPEYESFALGRRSDHWVYRFGRVWVLDADLNGLLGFCKWKDPEKYDPTLYQVFDIELSSVQSIVYNPVNREGLVFRVGIIENINYIIERKAKLQVGTFLGFGYKF